MHITNRMISQIFEFIGNHGLLNATFVALLIIFIANELKRGGRTISCQEVVDLLNRENAVAIDLRTEKEFSEGHISGALNVPYTLLEKHMNKLQKYKDTPIILTCKMGQQSGAAGNQLRKAGYANIARLSGGIQNWRISNMPVVKTKQ